MRWCEQDGESVHQETGCRLVSQGYRDNAWAAHLVWPKGEVTELRRDDRGRWRHPWLPECHDGGFATAQACADDLIDRVLERGVHAGTGLAVAS